MSECIFAMKDSHILSFPKRGDFLHFSFTVFILFDNLVFLIPSKLTGINKGGVLRKGEECFEGLPFTSLYGSVRSGLF